METKHGTDISSDPHRTMMFVGRNKSGKSWAAASFSIDTKTFCYDLDNRIRSVLPVYPNIDYVQLENGRGFAEMDEYIEKQIKQDKIGRLSYETFWYASLSSTETALILDAIKFLGEARAQSGGAGRKIGNIKMTDVQHYGYVSMASMQLWENGLINLIKNRYFIMEAHICTKFDKDGNNVGRMILTTDKTSERLPGRFDEIYEFTKETGSIVGSAPSYKVYFESDIASTAFPSLRKQRSLDITNKNFYKEWRRLIEPDLKGVKNAVTTK